MSNEERATKDGRSIRTRNDPYTGALDLFEVRVYVCRIYGGGSVHVGTGLDSESAELAACEWARKCGCTKTAIKKMLENSEMLAMPHGVTHFNVGGSGSYWDGVTADKRSDHLKRVEGKWILDPTVEP